jgi:predicted transcriptional regulator
LKTSSTTLKLPRELKARIGKLARKLGRTPHAFMIEALERQAAREERVAEFVAEALASDAEIEAGADVYAAEDVHAWLGRLARGERSARPKPWRE